MRSWIVLALVLVLATGAEACGGRHRRANVRACFANQKTLLGAIEMYNLDKNCRVEDHLDRLDDPLAYLEAKGVCTYPHAPEVKGTVPRVHFLPSNFLERLANEGYLQSVPRDPGQESAKNYALTSFGNGIVCMFHGDIAGSGAQSARKRLRDLGVRNPHVLERASDQDPRHEPISDEPYFMLLVSILSIAFLYTFGRMAGDPASAVGDRLGRTFLWGSLAMLVAAPLGLVRMEVFPLTAAAWQVGAAGAALLVGTARLFLGTWTPAEQAGEEPRNRARHPLPLLAPRGLKCAVCGCADGPALWVTCPACEAAHHGECWSFQDGCAAFGCAMAHGRWQSGALPRRTVAPDELEKGALRWVE